MAAVIEQKAAVSAVMTVSGASVFADISYLLAAFPLISFGLIGVVGGAMGYLLMAEQGRLDALSWQQSLCVMTRRVVLGAAIGTVVYVAWADQIEAKGLWLLATGVIATSPVELTRKAIDTMVGLFQRRTSG